ncbi:stage II sporulation protein AA (anti-sigma F factor antagonist) [Streptomyces sp. LBL]|uniref:STAS domain-containing protein n=1 Tax=Streptomyces sp. LBL TaxID=2940562 RepID=UPI002475E2D7|nr:STAS domain-containing protein [Streptomyces sp. LBL]MDH6629765.1 stage II sporulation protein AA (anti-sigma F factor antagonist) [Streptomyces sp. LBL]
MTFLPNPCDLRDLRDLPGCTTVVALPSEIDLSNVAGLLDRVMSAVDTRSDRLRVLVLDFTATDFMDSQGVRLVDEVRHRLQPEVRVRVVARPDGVATRVLELTGVRRDVPVYGDLSEALEDQGLGPGLD